MKPISELVGMPLVTVGEGLKLGSISGVELDVPDGRIRYFHVNGHGQRANGVVAWDSVRAVGAHAVTIDSRAAIRETVPNAERDRLTHFVGDRPVVTESGEKIGTITGYDVDETTGMVLCYHIRTGGLLGRLTGSAVNFPHSAIRTFGPDAIIVSDEVLAPAAHAAA